MEIVEKWSLADIYAANLVLNELDYVEAKQAEKIKKQTKKPSR